MSARRPIQSLADRFARYHNHQQLQIAPAEMARIRDAVKPVVEKYAANVGTEIWSEVQAAIAAARK